MNTQQQEFIKFISRSHENELYVRETGREVIDLPPHLHSRHQVVHTLSGTLRIQVGDKSYFVPEHHLAWIPGDTAHELSSNNRQIALNIFYGYLSNRGEDRFAIINTNSFITENLKYIVKSATNNSILRSETPEIYDFSLAFLNMLPAIGDRYETPLKALAIPEDVRLQEVLRHINAHLSDDLSMESVAEQAGMSVRNLSRLFHEADMNFTGYVNYQRITRAIELYADGGRNIQEIAYDVGFNTPNHFNRVFRQILGTNPGSFFKKKPGA